MDGRRSGLAAFPHQKRGQRNKDAGDGAPRLQIGAGDEDPAYSYLAASSVAIWVSWAWMFMLTGQLRMQRPQPTQERRSNFWT